MGNEEEELISEKEEGMKSKRGGVRVKEESPGRFAMVSKHRIRNKTDVAVGEHWEYESNREAGNNDPNQRFHKKTK